MLRTIVSVLDYLYIQPYLSQTPAEVEREWKRVLEEQTERETKQLYFLVMPGEQAVKMELEFCRRDLERHRYYSLRASILEIDGQLQKKDNMLFREWHSEMPSEQESKDVLAQLLGRFGLEGDLRLLPDNIGEELMTTNSIISDSLTTERRTS